MYKLYKKQRSLEVIDPRILVSDHQVQVEMEMCIQIGLLCVQSDPRTRPDMSRVVLILSKKPTVLQEPQRPGNPGTRYTLSRPPPTAAATATASSSLSSVPSQSFGSTPTSITTATASTTSDPHTYDQSSLAS